MSAWVHVAGWVLVHFIWQGALMALVSALVLRACRRRSASLRYGIACATLAAMLAGVAATAALVERGEGQQSTPLRLHVLVSREPARDAALPIQIDSRPLSMPRAFSRSDVEALFPWVVSIWSAGVILLLFRTAAGWWRVRRLHQRALQTVCSVWQLSGNRLAARLGLDRLVRIVELADVDVPFVVGCLRPIVVLPIAAIAQLNVAQVEAILAHELAHVRRHDYLVNLLQTLAETLFFYHPSVWWISARIRDEREHCCDDVAVEVCGDRVAYAAALAELESWRCGDIELVAAASGGSLVNRIRRILRVEISSQPQVSHVAIGLALIAGALGTAGVLAQSREASEDVKFEVASVRPNTSGNPGQRVEMQPGGRYTVINMPLRNLIINAYGLQANQLLGAPDWIAERFDITAKADEELGPPASQEGPSRLQLMMRSLLAERFKLSVHRESRDLPIYHLVLARNDRKLGPELTPSSIDCRTIIDARKAQGLRPEPPKPGERPQCGAWWGFGELTAGGQPLHELISLLSATVQRNVVDRTRLSGNFDIHLKWTPDQLPPRPPGLPADQPVRMNGVAIDPNGPSIFTALQEQLGLKLDAQRGPVDVLVIDRVERPTPD